MDEVIVLAVDPRRRVIKTPIELRKSDLEKVNEDELSWDARKIYRFMMKNISKIEEIREGKNKEVNNVVLELLEAEFNSKDYDYPWTIINFSEFIPIPVTFASKEGLVEGWILNPTEEELKRIDNFQAGELREMLLYIARENYNLDLTNKTINVLGKTFKFDSKNKLMKALSIIDYRKYMYLIDEEIRNHLDNNLLKVTWSNIRLTEKGMKKYGIPEKTGILSFALKESDFPEFDYEGSFINKKFTVSVRRSSIDLHDLQEYINKDIEEMKKVFGKTLRVIKELEAIKRTGKIISILPSHDTLPIEDEPSSKIVVVTEHPARVDIYVTKNRILARVKYNTYKKNVNITRLKKLEPTIKAEVNYARNVELIWQKKDVKDLNELLESIDRVTREVNSIKEKKKEINYS